MEALETEQGPASTDGRAAPLQRGTNQSGMRDHNERLVLILVRRHGSLAKTEIARMTRLSAQTVSVIMRELEADGLLLRGEPMRGKVGQPSVPMSLDPDGAFFLGAEDRPAQRRAGADRFPRRRSAADAAQSYRLPDAARHACDCRRRHARRGRG